MNAAIWTEACKRQNFVDYVWGVDGVGDGLMDQFADDEFPLGFPEQYRVSAEKVEEEERRAALAEAVGAVLGRPVKIRVDLEAGAPASAPSEDTLFRDMPLVDEIRERYGGEIVEEKEVAGPEE